MKINHINYPDKDSKIFCRKLNKPIVLDNQGKYWENCLNCPYFNGDYQGQGVECSWEDEGTSYSVYVEDSQAEYLRVSKLLDKEK